jgi:hypothetical protein
MPGKPLARGAPHHGDRLLQQSFRPSTQTFMVDGAVPDFGEIFSQGAFFVAAQCRVPPPVLRMDRLTLEKHPPRVL